MAIQPIFDFINQDPGRNWPLVEREFDKYSMYTFLKYYPHSFGAASSEGAIEMIGVLLGTEGYMEQSFLDIMRFLMPLRARRFYEIAGVTTCCPEPFFRNCRKTFCSNKE